MPSTAANARSIGGFRRTLCPLSLMCVPVPGAPSDRGYGRGSHSVMRDADAPHAVDDRSSRSDFGDAYVTTPVSSTVSASHFAPSGATRDLVFPEQPLYSANGVPTWSRHESGVGDFMPELPACLPWIEPRSACCSCAGSVASAGDVSWGSLVVVWRWWIVLGCFSVCAMSCVSYWYACEGVCCFEICGTHVQ